MTFIAEGGVRHTDPITSHEAAASIDLPHLRWIALRALRKNRNWPKSYNKGYLSYFEWSEVSGIPYSSITPRGKWLLDNGFIKFRILPGPNAQGNIKNLMHFKAEPYPRMFMDALMNWFGRVLW
jgi:hypothetical protein